MRQPRPKGSTYLSMKYQETNHDEDKQFLFRHIISMYTTDGFRWNGLPTNIAELSQLLKIPQPDIMDMISQVGTQMGSLASPENIKNTLQTIATLSTSFALQDRGLILQQLELLLVSQDGKYKPFVSSEVNKTLKLALDSNKNISEIYKQFTSQSATTNILNIFGEQGQPEEGQEYLTPDQALSLITDKRSSSRPANSLPAHPRLSSEADTAGIADELYGIYGVGDFEDVQERRSGTEALQAPELYGSEANRPAGLPAEEDGGHKRRGIEVVDVDELPTTE